MKILLIEDDIFFQKFYSFKLSEAGFEVVTATDGIIGLEEMKKTLPNLILLDLVMPNKDGFGVLEDKKADPQIAGIPVVIFSTLGQEEDIKRAMSLGATDYVNKSFFDFDKLVAKIKSIIPK